MKLAGRAAEVAHGVHGRHGETGAVGQHADAAVELDELEAEGLAARLQLRELVRRARHGQLRVARHGRCRPWRICSRARSAGRPVVSTSGLISTSSASLAGIGRVEPAQQSNERGRDRTAAAPAAPARGPWGRAHCGYRPAAAAARRGASRRSPRCPCRPARRTAAAAFGAGIVQHGRVHLARDRHLLLDQHLSTRCSPMLMPRMAAAAGVGLVRRCRQLDAAGLAALAGRHLRLDHTRPDPRAASRGLFGRPRQRAAACRCRLRAATAWQRALRSSSSSRRLRCTSAMGSS